MIALIFELGSLIVQLGLLCIACIALSVVAEKILPFHKVHARLGVLAFGLLIAWGLILLRERGTHFDWEQEVRLSDGKSLWIKRRTTFGNFGEAAQINQAKSLLEEFEVVNPQTGQLVSWQRQYDLEPLLLDFDQGIPYLATDIKAGKHFALGCPPHPYAFFKYSYGKWERIGIKSFPMHFKKSNVYLELEDSTRRRMLDTGSRKMSADMVEGKFKPPMPDWVRAIDRRIVNPMYFCGGSTILKNIDGTRREVTLDTFYGKGTGKRLGDRYGWNDIRTFMSEQEAIEFGIVKIGEGK